MHTFTVHCSVLSSDSKTSVQCYITSPFSTFVHCDVIAQMANNSWYVDSCPIDRCTLQSLTNYSTTSTVTPSKVCSWWCMRMVACEDPLFCCLPCTTWIWQDFWIPAWQEMRALPQTHHGSRECFGPEFFHHLLLRIHLTVNQLMPHGYVWEYIPPKLHIWHRATL